MSCIQDGVEWVVVGRAAKGGSWAMWWFTVSSGGLKWWTQEGETEGDGGGRATAAAFEEEDRRGRALMYELTPRKEKKRTREREASAREEGTKFSPAKG